MIQIDYTNIKFHSPWGFRHWIALHDSKESHCPESVGHHENTLTTCGLCREARQKHSVKNIKLHSTKLVDSSLKGDAIKTCKDR